MKLKSKWSKIHPHKNKKIVFIAAVFIVLIAFGVLFSIKNWNDFKSDYNNDFSKIKINFEDIVTSKSDSAKEKLANIIKNQTAISNKLSQICNISPLIKWQNFIKSNSDELNNCRQRKENMTILLSDLNNITKYVVAEQKLVDIITIANDNTNNNNNSEKWINIEGFWRSAITQVNDLNNLNENKKVAIMSLTSIADSWKNIADSNEKQDRTEFETSHSNINAAYDTLFEISESSKDINTKLITDLAMDYNKL